MIGRLRQSVLLAVVFFALNHVGVISGAISPPAGYRAAWVIRNLDIPQYITWINESRHRLLLADLHAPWQTGPGLFEPLFWLIARIPLPTLFAYYLAHFTLFCSAFYALLCAAEAFCRGREKWIALAAALCAVPLYLFGWAAAFACNSLKWQAVFASGLLDYGYDSADGLFRGGLSNSPTLTMGTIFVLVSMTLLAKYAESSARKFWIALCAVTFVSALMHPFEVFLIVAASAVPLLMRRRIFDWLGVGISGFLGLTPYLLLGIKSEWLRDAGDISPSSFHPLTIAAKFGLPCIAAAYFLAMRFRMPLPSDVVLKSWFISIPILFVLPGVPFPLHLLNGFAYCTGFLLVRRLATDKQIRPAMERHPRAAWGIFGALGALSAAALAVFYAQVWRDGKNPDPLWLLNTLERTEQKTLIDWVRDHSAPDALVFAPIDVAPWLATIPRTTFASHDLFSITYPKQAEEVEKAAKGEIPMQEIVDRYGVRIAVIPAKSAARIPAENWRADIGPWKIYEFPGAKLKPYPGLKVLDPGVRRSARSRVLGWIANCCGKRQE